MMRSIVLTALFALAACGGTAPAVQSPTKALHGDGTADQRCAANSPPAGYQGPISPYGGSCMGDGRGPVVAPAGVHDYSKGQPARVVR